MSTTITITTPASRRFPYRPAPGASQKEIDDIRSAIDEAIRGVDRAIYKEARALFSQDEDRVRECHQHVCLVLWRHTLPAFDASRGAKVSSFLMGGCIHRAALGYLKLEQQKPKSCRWWKRGWGAVPMNHTARDEAGDETIERLADAIMRNADGVVRYPAEVRLLRSMLDNPTLSPREVAAKIGLSWANVSTRMSHIFNQLRAINRDEFAELLEKLEIENG